MTTKTPNPGSPEAVALGCACPRIDNGHGRGYMGIEGMFVLVEGCPLHPMPKDEDEAALVGPQS